jgi:hypothetical protein
MDKLAECYARLGRYADALKVQEDSLARRKARFGAEQGETILAMHTRAKLYISAGRSHDALHLCMSTGQLWDNLNRTDANSLYNAACLHAVAAAVICDSDHSAESISEAIAEANLAMARLKTAVAAGFSNAALIASDEDLKSLRGREDFQKLLSSLSSAPSQIQGPAP